MGSSTCSGLGARPAAQELRASQVIEVTWAHQGGPDPGCPGSLQKSDQDTDTHRADPVRTQGEHNSPYTRREAPGGPHLPAAGPRALASRTGTVSICGHGDLLLGEGGPQGLHLHFSPTLGPLWVGRRLCSCFSTPQSLLAGEGWGGPGRLGESLGGPGARLGTHANRSSGSDPHWPPRLEFRRERAARCRQASQLLPAISRIRGKAARSQGAQDALGVRGVGQPARA